MNFLFVSNHKEHNALLDKARSAGINCVIWSLAEFENGDPVAFDALFFMPGYNSWPAGERQLELMKKLKFYGEKHRIYYEYLQTYDYLFIQNAVRFKQSYPVRPMALERAVIMRKHPVTDGFALHELLPVAAQCKFVPGRGCFLQDLISFGSLRGVHKVCGAMPKPWELYPALMYDPAGEHLVASFELSRCREWAFPLAKRWDRLLSNIILHLIPDAERENYRARLYDCDLRLTPDVWAEPGSSIEVKSDRRGNYTLENDSKAQVFKNRKSFTFTAEKVGKYTVTSLNGDKAQTVLEVMPRNKFYRRSLDLLVKWYFKSGVMPQADGSAGVYEGFASFDHRLVNTMRPDCHCETALFLAQYGALSGEKDKYFAIAKNIFNYLQKKNFQDLNTQRESYGFWRFFDDFCDAPLTIYCNDNSWVAMTLFELYKLTGDSDYLESAKLTLEAIYRTRCLEIATSIKGQRLNELGAEAYYKEWTQYPIRNPFVPMLLAYGGKFLNDQKYLDRAEELLHPYTDNPRSAQMQIFPIAMYSFIYQATGKNEYLEELYRRTEHLCSFQGAEGAFRHIFPHPEVIRKSYGIGEMDIIHKPDDPIAEILYVNGPAAYALFEAYQATGEQKFFAAWEKLLDFMARIQIKSSDRRLNGAWMRGYDLKNRDYYASNADADWGTYCVESGWCNTWVGKAWINYLNNKNIK